MSERWRIQRRLLAVGKPKSERKNRLFGNGNRVLLFALRGGETLFLRTGLVALPGCGMRHESQQLGGFHAAGMRQYVACSFCIRGALEWRRQAWREVALHTPGSCCNWLVWGVGRRVTAALPPRAGKCTHTEACYRLYCMLVPSVCLACRFLSHFMDSQLPVSLFSTFLLTHPNYHPCIATTGPSSKHHERPQQSVSHAAPETTCTPHWRAVFPPSCWLRA